MSSGSPDTAGGRRCAGGRHRPKFYFKTLHGVHPLLSDAEYRCSDCGVGQIELLTDGGQTPFGFRVEDKQRLTSLLGEETTTVVTALEVQIRQYQCVVSGISSLPLLPTVPPAKRQVRRSQLHRLASALSELDAALHAYGDAWWLYNQARGYPAFEREDDDDWPGWLADLGAMREVACEEARRKRRRGPHPDGPRRLLEHRLARVLADTGPGRASMASTEVFRIAVKAATGTDYRDPKRALARAHGLRFQPVMTAQDANRLIKKAEQRTKVRGFL